MKLKLILICQCKEAEVFRMAQVQPVVWRVFAHDIKCEQCGFVSHVRLEIEQ